MLRKNGFLARFIGLSASGGVSHAIYGVVKKFQFAKGRFNVLTRLALAKLEAQAKKKNVKTLF